MAYRKRYPCVDCDKRTTAIHPILDIPVCPVCRGKYEKYKCITKTRAKDTYRLKDTDLQLLKVFKLANPYYSVAAPMQLYLHSQIKELAAQKWGSSEPYLVSLTDFSPEQLRWIYEDLERVKQLDPRKFQYLIADRLSQMGLSVQLVGDVYRKDGGIDIMLIQINVPFRFYLAFRQNIITQIEKQRLAMFATCTALFQETHLLFKWG